MENVLLLRHIEYRARLSRIISVLRMRDREHDTTLREFRIGHGGIHMLGPFQPQDDLPIGMGREALAGS